MSILNAELPDSNDAQVQRDQRRTVGGEMEAAAGRLWALCLWCMRDSERE